MTEMKYFIDSAGGLHVIDDGHESMIQGDVRELSADEYMTIVESHLTPTFAQALAAINTVYVKDRDDLCAAWLRAAVADGVDESSRKEDVEMELAELDAKHAADVAALKLEYGVA